MIKKKKEKIQLDHNNIWFCSKLPAEGFKPSYPSSKIMNYVSTLKCALVVMLGVQANLVHDRAAGERYCQEFCQDVLEHNPAWTVEFHITCRCRKDSDRSSTAVIGSNCELCSSEGDFALDLQKRILFLMAAERTRYLNTASSTPQDLIEAITCARQNIMLLDLTTSLRAGN